MASPVPAPTLGPTGFIAPAESAIRAGVLAILNTAFGVLFTGAPSTPQGQLSDAFAAVIGYTNDLFLYYVNQVDPDYASGRMQDAIARIYFLFRKGPLPTTVIATYGGASGTVIPAGSLALAADGTIYQSTGLITIPLAGTIDGEFTAIVNGPIACPSGTLSTIYRAVPGWDTITNASDGILGRDTETRSDFEARRAASVEKNAVGILGSIKGQVLAVDSVLDAYVLDNPTSGSVSVGGITLGPNALYVAAVGGTDEDVARAIWTKKAPGCDYYAGNTTVTVEDRSYPVPYPSYDVVFERPDDLPIFFDVELASSSAVPSDAVAQVRAAIISAFNGGDGGGRASIGATIFASRYICPVGALGSWVRITSLKVGLTSPGAADSVTVDIDQAPTITSGDITVNIT